MSRSQERTKHTKYLDGPGYVRFLPDICFGPPVQYWLWSKLFNTRLLRSNGKPLLGGERGVRKYLTACVLAAEYAPPASIRCLKRRGSLVCTIFEEEHPQVHSKRDILCYVGALVEHQP